MKLQNKLNLLTALFTAFGLMGCGDDNNAKECSFTHEMCASFNKTLDAEKCICVDKSNACILTEENCKDNGKTLDAERCICVEKTQQQCVISQDSCASINKAFDAENCLCVDKTPGGNQPGGNQSGGSEPGGTEPGGSEPGGNQPGSSEPGGTEPGGSEPGSSEPGGSEPGGTEPGGNQPGGTEPGGNQPGGTEPGGSEPGNPAGLVAPTVGTDLSQVQNIAPSFASKKGNDLYDVLGSKIVDGGVNFAVFARNATRVEVLIFDSKNPDTDEPLARIPLMKDETSGIWTKFVKGIGAGTHYGYIAFGPNWPYDANFKPGTTVGFNRDCDENGNRYNPNKLLTDPYSRRIHRDFDWNLGIPLTGVGRNVSDWKASPKSVVIESEYKWSDHETTWRSNRMKGDAFAGHAQNDLIIYEVHPKGFTKQALDINNPGTWRGIGEKAEYLKDLGITALELMPVGEKPDDGTYWGYNTINFFAPEQRFATTSDQNKANGVHDEFKEMVDKLHQAGIEVILDVVYNHTGEGGFWGSKVQDPSVSYGAYSNFDDKTAALIYSFRGLDNKAYYHLIQDSYSRPNQNYLDETGVGNQMRTNVLPFRRLIVDNLRFWVEEMHVDGFRFDLAAILGVDDSGVSQTGDAHSGDNAYWANYVTGTVLQDIIDDDVMAQYHTRFIAEPWSLAQYANGLFPKSTKHANHAWFEWNGRFRDMIRPFVNFDDYTLGKTESVAPYWNPDMNIGNLLTGSSVFFGNYGDFEASSNRRPYNSVNYLTAHDGFTLYDVVSYNQKINGCSMLNSICCSGSYLAFCDVASGEDENKSRNWCEISDCWDGGCNTEPNRDDQGMCKDTSKEELKRQMIRNYFALLMVSHGTPMILGGDEYMRTQYGNNNAYADSFDNVYNWFRWIDWMDNSAAMRMHDFVRDLIRIRKQYKAFLSPSEYDSTGLQWVWPDGCDDTVNGCWSGKSVAMYYPGNSTTKALFVLINMETYDEKKFNLSTGEWKVLMDTQSWFDSAEFFNATPGKDPKTTHNTWLAGSNVVSGTYTVKPRSVVILGK